MFHVEQAVIYVSDSEKYSDYRIKDFLVSGEEFTLEQNPRYGFLETQPRPDPESLPSYYESDSYISHNDSKKGLISFLYHLVKKYSLRKKLQMIFKMAAKKGSLLDIGAGTGEFLKVAMDGGWNTSGTEPSEKARQLAQMKGIVLEPYIDNYVGKKFDVITLWHVLEHVPDLEITLQKIQNLLKDEGLLIIAVPNFNSWDSRYYKSYWAAFDVPRHLWHFSRSSMRSLIPEELKLLKTKPMVFDSYYVSLLSEKYRSGNAFSIKALWLGFRSNWSAMFTGEYSSLIYCFKKTY